MSQDKEREAWKVGNEFAPYHPDASHVDPQYRDGWDACYRAALASQPPAVQGEIVAWGWRSADGQIRDCIAPDTHAHQEGEYTIPLCASPPSREPLTDEQIDACWDGLTPSGYGKSRYDIARAIERAHGIHSHGEGES